MPRPDLHRFSASCSIAAGLVLQLATFLFPPSPAFAIHRFGRDVQVNDSAEAAVVGGGHCVEMRNGVLHAIWHDARQGPRHIYFARSFDGGDSFEPARPLSEGLQACLNATLRMDQAGERIFVVWEQEEAIQFTRSVNGGTTFEAPRRLDSRAAFPGERGGSPMLAANDQGVVYVAWEDTRSSGRYSESLYYARSDDDGASFSGDAKAQLYYENNPWAPLLGAASIAVGPEGTVYLAVQELVPDATFTFVTVSRDGGASFETPVYVRCPVRDLASTVTEDGIYHLFVYGQSQSVIFSNPHEFYYLRSLDLGHSLGRPRLVEQWDELGGLWYGPEVDLGSSGTNVILGWRTRDGEIRARVSYDSGMNFERRLRVSDSGSVEPTGPSVSIDRNGQVAALWTDERLDGGPDVFADAAVVTTEVPENTVTSDGRAKDIALFDPAPHPVRSGTSLSFALPEESGTSIATLTLYDARGRVVRELEARAGADRSGQVQWDGADAQGSPVAPGVYFARLTVGTESATRRIVVGR